MILKDIQNSIQSDHEELFNLYIKLVKRIVKQ